VVRAIPSWRVVRACGQNSPPTQGGPTLVTYSDRAYIRGVAQFQQPDELLALADKPVY
jgi:hypothetical protein